jgi:hypothetical protein
LFIVGSIATLQLNISMENEKMADKKSRINPYPVETTKAVVEGKVAVNGTDMTHRDPKGDGAGFDQEGVKNLVAAMEKGQRRPVF